MVWEASGPFFPSERFRASLRLRASYSCLSSRVSNTLQVKFTNFLASSPSRVVQVSRIPRE